MTDTQREMPSGAQGIDAKRPADRRANVGEYLLAMSHEIRAPLNAVIGMSGMLLDGGLDEKNRQYARSVHSAGESLAAILNDLLDLSRVTVGRLVVEPIPFDLKSTIEETASVLSPRANERGLILRVDWRPELPRHVIGDPGRTRQVLGNLIGHAVNATSQGEVVIRVMPDGERGGVPSVKFVVEDTGIGIMPERLAHIFDDYVPVDASPYRSFGVTGLGLRLSADLVRRMGGDIGASSEAGRGSCFWFVLPMANAEPSTMPMVGEPRRGGRALVVEADASARSRYVDQIEEADWEVDFTDSLGGVIEELRRAVEQGDPYHACFISDYAVRPLHIDLAVKVKAEADLAKTALIMVTAVGSPGEGKKLWHAGFAAYLRKPVPHEEMRDTLAALNEIGPGGRGASLITRHSLAEARNAQAFAPDGIDEMLASLTPTNDAVPAATAEPSFLDRKEPPTEASIEPTPESPVEPVTDGLAALSGETVLELQGGAEPTADAVVESAQSEIALAPPTPPAPVVVSSYLPLFAAAPVVAAPPSPSPEAESHPVEVVDSLTVDEPISEPVAPQLKVVVPELVPDQLDRPEEFDPSSVEAIRAEGLDTPESLMANFAHIEGLQGHDFGAGQSNAIVEPVEAVPTGAVVEPPPSPEPVELSLSEPVGDDLPDLTLAELEPLPAAAPAPESHSVEIAVDFGAMGTEAAVDAAPAIPAAAVEVPSLSLDVASESIENVAAPTAEAAAVSPPAAQAEPTRVASPAPEPGPDPASLPVVGAAIADQLAHGGGFFTHYLVSSFLRETAAGIAELATATNRGDGERIKQALASIRTAAGWVGAERLSARCAQAEAAVGQDRLDECTSSIGGIERAFVEARDGLDLATPTGLPAEIPAVGPAFLDQIGPDREGPAKALATRLIDSFSNDASARILELREAVARGDADGAQRLAQALKGMCGLISAEPLAKLCALVEADARLKRIGQADRYLDHLDREIERVRQILTSARG